MPERGPAQLLLLLSPPRAKLGWRVGLAAAAIATLGLLPGDGSVYHQAKTGIAQSLRQAAWNRALAGEAADRSWPWSEASPVAYSRVPRLGLSAALLHDKDDDHALPPHGGLQGSAIPGGGDPHLAGGVDVGDEITVTKADGSSQSYRVTGFELFDSMGSRHRDAADPHLPRAESPLGSVLRLIIEAVQADSLEQQATSGEHKL